VRGVFERACQSQKEREEEEEEEGQEIIAPDFVCRLALIWRRLASAAKRQLFSAKSEADFTKLAGLRFPRI
jgi:hypothetical protein